MTSLKEGTLYKTYCPNNYLHRNFRDNLCYDCSPNSIDGRRPPLHRQCLLCFGACYTVTNFSKTHKPTCVLYKPLGEQQIQAEPPQQLRTNAVITNVAAQLQPQPQRYQQTHFMLPLQVSTHRPSETRQPMGWYEPNTGTAFFFNNSSMYSALTTTSVAAASLYNYYYNLKPQPSLVPLFIKAVTMIYNPRLQLDHQLTVDEVSFTSIADSLKQLYVNSFEARYLAQHVFDRDEQVNPFLKDLFTELTEALMQGREQMLILRYNTWPLSLVTYKQEETAQDSTCMYITNVVTGKEHWHSKHATTLLSTLAWLRDDISSFYGYVRRRNHSAQTVYECICDNLNKNKFPCYLESNGNHGQEKFKDYLKFTFHKLKNVQQSITSGQLRHDLLDSPVLPVNDDATSGGGDSFCPQS